MGVCCVGQRWCVRRIPASSCVDRACRVGRSRMVLGSVAVSAGPRPRCTVGHHTTPLPASTGLRGGSLAVNARHEPTAKRRGPRPDPFPNIDISETCLAESQRRGIGARRRGGAVGRRCGRPIGPGLPGAVRGRGRRRSDRRGSRGSRPRTVAPWTTGRVYLHIWETGV
jgi:hypothetical protein